MAQETKCITTNEKRLAQELNPESRPQLQLRRQSDGHQVW